MHRRLVVAPVALALAVVLAACVDPVDSERAEDAEPAPAPASTGAAGQPQAATTSTALPDLEDATLQGRVLGPDGQPLAGAVVSITGHPGAGEQFAGFLGFTFSGGLTCFTGECIPGSESDSLQTATGPDGRFSATLPAAHMPGYETDTDWFVTVSQPAAPPLAAGAVSFEEFEVAAAVQDSPDLVLWAPPVDVTADPRRVAVSWPVLAPDRFDGRRLDYQLQVVDGQGRAVWSVDGVAPGAQLDARLLEDVRGSVAVVARGDVTAGPTIYHQTMSAPRPAFDGPAGPPPSRGAGCLVAATGPCWLTDGDLVATRPGPPTCPEPIELPPGIAEEFEVPELPDFPGFEQPPCQPPVTEAAIDLGREIDVGLVVVRGSCSCTIELSRDGQQWRPAGSVGGLGGPELLTPSGPARFVRAISEDGGVEGISELSVWPAIPRQPQPADSGLLPPSADGPGARGGSDADDDDLKRWAILALLLAAAVAAAATWVGVRSRQHP